MASPTVKHFFALMHKNWIIYKRNPFSAVCQFITPVLLMLIMVWLRTVITPKEFDSTSLLQLSHPIYTIATEGQQLQPLASTKLLESFFVYNNYTDIFGQGYDVLYDYQSPTYFYPTNCGSQASFVKGDIPSSIIAFVGQNSTVSQNVQNYLTLLFQDQKILGVGLKPTFQWYASQDDLFDYIRSDTYLNPDIGICFGFEIKEQSSSDWAINLFFDDQKLFGGASASSIPSTKNDVFSNAYQKPFLKPYQQYSLDGYTFMQNIIANMVLREVTQVPNANINMMVIPMQSNALIVDKFAVLWSILADLILLLYVIPVYNMVFFIVKEKEQRVKESMRMMGLTDLPYWLSWLCYYTIINTVTATLAWSILSINVFVYSTQFYIFMWIWLYGQSLFGQIIFIQSLFSKSKYAGIVATVVYFLCPFGNIPILSGTSPYWAKLVLSIIPQTNLYQSAFWICDFEGIGLGLTRSTAWENRYNYSAGEGFVLYGVGGLLWLILGLYLDAVIPTEYGTQKHPCYICMPQTYGCCRGGRRQVAEIDDDNDEGDRLVSQNEIKDSELEVKFLRPENYEPVQAEIARQEQNGGYLRIENLTKTYNNGFAAVKGINLKIYQNQIFALLGQNGAGKSTTISMLTGLIESSSGTARVFGLDMFKQGQQVRQFLGVCPQHDVLFEYLTPVEHLSIFYDFKGGDPLKKQQEIIDLIRDVGLEEDQLKPAGSLSGGNKRKLSVAIAMCGGSKLVLLDEPTAGMDLGARRALWDMLKNYRSDRIIILTTHYMDEADVLGDRIGIMSQGQMKCLGSSLFLKKRFGAGYKLTMVKETKEKNSLVLPYIEKNLGSAELISEVSSEISFGVQEEVASGFNNFFKKFDQDMTKLGIISYGISISTLEEVFLHINKELGLELTHTTNSFQQDLPLKVDQSIAVEEVDPYSQLPDHRKPLNVNDSGRGSVLGSQLSSSYVQSKARFSKITTDTENGPLGGQTERLVGDSSVSQQIAALMTKRYHVYKRDRAGLICEVIVPFIMVFVGCALTLIVLTKDSPARYLTPSLYPSPQRILMNNSTVVDVGIGNISPQVLFSNLPKSSTQFQVTYTENATFTEFYNSTFSQRLVGANLPYRYGSYQIYKADNNSMQYSVNCFLNLTSPDVTALIPQFMYESILATASGNPNFNFNVSTVPYPTMATLRARDDAGNGFTFSFMVGIGISLIPCAMISFILKEREDNLKHMQLISGMSLSAYWISNMISDIIKVYIPLILMIILSFIFGTNYAGVWVLFLLLPWALVPFTYITSFLFSNDTNAQIMSLLLHFLVSVVLATAVYFLQLIPETFAIGDKLRWYLCVFPTYCLVNGILWSAEGKNIITARSSNPDYPQWPKETWAFDNLTGDAVAMMIHFVVDTLILVLIEKDAFSFIQKLIVKQLPERDPTIKYDSDVKAEEDRVALNDNEVVRVFNFRKQYNSSLFGTPFLAVESITFGLDYGECFALLGVNGAGKSTTFKSLTAGTLPSHGEISIAGFSITKQFDKVRKLIGYCPQHDAVFPLMTVEEHLWFYAKLKGIPIEKRSETIETAIINMNLTDHRTKPAGTLSGGNKRKLSVAMATLGNPPIILLDEPSAGMDPEARRFMWQVVANISQRDKNSAVIITTHSMEEAEALSTKMGIMVRGGIFQCYGSSQHIKSKFGTGYELEVKIKKQSFEEMNSFAQNLGFTWSAEERINLQEAILKAKQAGINVLVLEEIKSQGLGSDLALEAAQSSEMVKIKNFTTYLYTQCTGLKVIEMICGLFSKVELYEQCSDFFKMRIPREEYTIGALFGVIQEKKDQLAISEYSVSQTSLEQIFQTFANQSSKNKKSSFVFHLDQGKFQLIR